MKLLDRYLFKELLLSWAAVSAVLLLILLGNSAVVILSKVAEGDLPSDVIAPFLLTNMVMLAVAIVPFGLYLGIILGLGRLYKDSEMAAMAACGVGGWDIYRPAFCLGAIAIALIIYLSFWATPWSARMEQSLEAALSQRSELSNIVPGRFNESRDRGTVMFVRARSDDEQTMLDVFVQAPDPSGARSLEVARYAEQRSTPQGQYIVLREGRRYVGEPGQANFRVMTFAEHGILIPAVEPQTASLVRAGKSVAELRNSSDVKDHAELAGRIAMPVAALILTWLAVPLSETAPRQGRYARLVVAILIYLPYWNLLLVAKRWMREGLTPEWLGIWWVHVLLLLILVPWFERQRVWRFFRAVKA